MKSSSALFALLLFACNGPSEKKTSQDSVAVDSLTAVVIQESFTPQTPQKEVTQNFPEVMMNTMTEDEREVKLWNVLSPLLTQYDTTKFHTLSKYYTVPQTEETPDETLQSQTTITLTLYYNDAQELKAIKRDYQYELGGPDRFEKTFTLYLFDGDLVAFYEDSDVSLDMAVKNFSRGAAKACPDCGVYLSAGVSSNEVIVSGTATAQNFESWSTNGLLQESNLLRSITVNSFKPTGNDYTHENVEPLNEEVDYEVYYTASKSYYEKFMRPKLQQ